MKIKQLSVFLENKKGRLYECLKILKEGNINIRALSIADTSEFGILRMIVDEPEKGKGLLQENGFTCKITNVVAVGVKDRPGGLAEILEHLYREDINVEYVYAFVKKAGEEAIVIMRTNNLDKTIDVLKNKDINLYPFEDLLKI